MYPKYYKNSNESCTFAVFGCQGITEIFCNFEYPTFEGVFLILLWAKSI